MRGARCSVAYVVGLSLVAVLVASASGCAADPKGGPTNGGGGAGAGLDCSGNLSLSDNTISDFESGSGTVFPSDGRNGAWYGYNDQSATCAEDPAQGAANVPATTLEAPRCGSLAALRMKGMGCTIWGAGMGTDLAAPLPPDAGSDSDASADAGAGAGKARKIPYDMSPFRAISFWGRIGAGTTSAVRFKIPMLVDSKVVDGGLCQLSETGTDKCSDDWGRALTFSTAWKQFTVPLDDDATTGLSTEWWGKKFPLDLTNVTAIQFQVTVGTTFDVWIDDVNLVRK
jgi:hypothetical protein